MRERSQRWFYSVGPEQLERWSYCQLRCGKLWVEEIWGEGDIGVWFGHTKDEISVRNPFGDAEWGRQSNGPQDAHILISRTCDYVVSGSKKGLVNVTKLRILRWTEYLGLFGWTQPHHTSPEKWRTFPVLVRGRCDWRRMVREMQRCWLWS